MKKTLTLVSILLVASPLFAATKCKENCKKHHKKDYQAAEYSKEEPVTLAEIEKPQPDTENPYLKNLSGTMAIASNYVFRGVSQTQNLAATQAGLTYSFPIGLYLNLWGSNVKFADPVGRNATVELDTIAGWRGSFWKELISYDINVDRYNYPQARGANYNELNTLFSISFFKLGLSYSSNAYGYHKSGTYVNGTLSYDIPPQYALNFNGLSAQAEMGHYSLARVAGNSYNDYSLTLNKQLNSTYIATLQWTGTDGRQHNAPLDSNHILGIITANF